jgi:hypothetical protein
MFGGLSHILPRVTQQMHDPTRPLIEICTLINVNYLTAYLKTEQPFELVSSEHFLLLQLRIFYRW